MKLYFPVTVDLYNIYPLPIMNTQQYNIGRGALVTLTAAGQLVVPSAEQLYIYAKKKDGTLVYASCTLSGDQIKVDYDEQMTAVPGTMQMELQMIDGNGNSITTPIFLVNVQPSNIDYKAITSSDEFTALIDALTRVENVVNFSGLEDRGGYSASEVYEKNDLVHFNGSIWKCLIDNTTNIEPEKDSEAWEIFIELNDPYYGPYGSFPKPPDQEDKLKLYIDDTNPDYRLIYTWSDQENRYVITGGTGGEGGGSVDIPITLTSSGWTGTTAPYSQTITVPQMREKMKPFFFLNTQGDPAEYAFSLLTGYNTGYAEITFYAADKPAVDIDLILKGIPAQELEYVDNTVVFLVEPSAFTQNATTQRYEATITVPGMTEGTGGVWDIVRSGTDLTVAESKIALSITDVDRQDGAVKITCLEVPAQRYMMSIAGAYPDAEPGTVILAGMQEWFDRVEALEENFIIKYKDVTIPSDTYQANETKSKNVTIPGVSVLFCIGGRIVGSTTASHQGQFSISLGGADVVFITNNYNGILTDELAVRIWYAEHKGV